MLEPQHSRISPLPVRRLEVRRISANARGAAPWNEKIDCFSSPTAKIVRLTVARARAGEELGDQRADDLPLLRAGVLRLVDQDVVDAAVELVMHPGRPDLVEQRERLVDQVVVVEQPAPVLLGLIARDHRIGDGEERCGAVAAGDRLAALESGRRRAPLRSKALRSSGSLFERRGDDRLRGSSAGEENRR